MASTDSCNQNDVDGSQSVPLSDEIIEYERGSGLLGLEDVQRYNKGGNHPVHLDDILDGRFEVVHRLGNGGFGIVWLCRDIAAGKWRAVKIMAADQSLSETEEKVFSRLRERCTPEELEDNHIMIPLEEFWLEGPNGRHRCQVMPVCGWKVSSWRLSQMGYKPGTDENSRDACRQIIKSLNFLHSHGICHGDFRPENILMKLEGIDELDKDELLDIMEEPECYEVVTESGKPPGPRAPEYCVQPLDGWWCKKFSTNSIVVIDFGEAFFMESPPETTGITSLYAAPEILFRGTGLPGPHSDIWALACTIFEVRTDCPLFASVIGGFGLPVRAIESWLGSLPPVYQWAFSDMIRSIPRASASIQPADSTRKEPTPNPWLGQEGQFESEKGPDTLNFEEVLSHEQKVYRNLQPPGDVPADQQSSEFIRWRYPQEEVVELADLLNNMLNYDPARRINISAVALHPWASTNRKY
ncbi:kinase-like protein [Hypoxylon sp. FL1150]|nr:kinase-like protein [Hypoxylon sp. FL1150]